MCVDRQRSAKLVAVDRKVTRAVLSQGGPRDAAVNFDKKFTTASRGFCATARLSMYSPTSATVQMMKSLTVPRFSRPWRETRRYSPKSRHTTGKSHDDRKYVIILQR